MFSNFIRGRVIFAYEIKVSSQQRLVVVDVLTSDADRVKISRFVNALSCAVTEHLMRTVSGGLSQQEKAPAELGLIELSFCLSRRLSGETSESLRLVCP